MSMSFLFPSFVSPAFALYHSNKTTNKSAQPFNAFLSGFSAAVGQFVLTASLRMQTSERSPSTASSTAKTMTKPGETFEENPSHISSERAFADFVLGSLILHGFCVNFIN